MQLPNFIKTIVSNLRGNASKKTQSPLAEPAFAGSQHMRARMNDAEVRRARILSGQEKASERPPLSPRERLRTQPANQNSSAPSRSEADNKLMARRMMGRDENPASDDAPGHTTRLLVKPHPSTVIEAEEFKKRESIFKNPKVKGFLTGAFASAAAMGTAKLAFNTAIRTFDTTGIGIALGTGTWNTGREIIVDYKKARAILIENEQTSRLDAFRSIWTKDNSKKYVLKFAKGSAVGLIGAGAADLLLEHGGSFTDTLKEWTKPLRDFTAPVTNWFTSVKESVSNFFGGLFKHEASLPTSARVVSGSVTESATATPSLPATEPVPAPPTAAPATPAPAVEIETPAPAPATAPALPINETTITEILSPRAQLEQLAASGELKGRAVNTVKAALAGKGWAMNEAIDGMINNRFGFTANPELAVKLTQELAASGNVEGQLKLAYMQYNGTFEGVAANRQAALETIHKLGRSWVGGEALLEKIPGSGPADTFVSPPLPAPIEMPLTPDPMDTPAMREAMNCTAQQNMPGIAPQFKTSCVPTGGDFKPGNTIGLNVQFNNGSEISLPMKIGPKALEMSRAQYLEQALSSALSQIPAPAAPVAVMTVSR